jgi:sulfatase maturation enzyme AslB (radical SAM superfamily)
MTLKDSFCPSPWFHMRINNSGHYEYCRWADKAHRNTGPNISDTTPAEFFNQNLIPIRQQLLNGERPTGCAECYQMEAHNKISGRQKQLLKIGVQLSEFDKMLASSPWMPVFVNHMPQMPQDWQIDLGNYCNSACVFCHPSFSSRLATEWKHLGFIDKTPPANWCDDPVYLQIFIDTLVKSPHIQYLHFIGGETLITPAFKKILKALIDAGLNKTATIGFTTNLISWDNDTISLLTQFVGVNLGVSIEAFDSVNEYARWPAKQQQVNDILSQWVALSQQHNWLMQIRTTPTILTIHKLLTVYDYAWEHGIVVESCNFLAEPTYLRPVVLPQKYRQPIIDQMQAWIDQRPNSVETVVNIRHPDFVYAQIVQDLQSYVNYLQTEADQSDQLPVLVQFLKRLELNRKNNILDHVPQYEELFRSAGY